MELDRGVCFFCSNGKVISQSKKVHKTIKTVFNNSNINEEQLEYVEPEVCPVCYHKLILLKKIHENISSSEKSDSTKSSNCKLCGSSEEIFVVSKWNVFDKIGNDFPALTSGKRNSVCSACFFYLDVRNFMKEKLVLKYPTPKVSQISSSKFGSVKQDHSTPTLEKKMRPKRGLKGSPKFGTDLTTHSTPIPERRKTQTRAERDATTAIDLTDEESHPSIPPLNFETLRQMQDDMILSRMVLADPKFMDQVLIVRLNALDKSLEKATNLINKERTRRRVTFLDEVSSEEQRTPRRSKSQKITEEYIRKETEVGQIEKNTFKRLRARKNEADAHIIQGDKTRRRKAEEIEPSEVDERKKGEDYSERSKISDVSKWEKRADSPDPRQKAFFKIKLKTKKSNPVKKDFPEEPSEINPTDFKMSKLVVNIERMQMPEVNGSQENDIIESEEFFDLRLESEEEQVETSDGKMETEDDTGCNTEYNNKQEKVNGHIEGGYSQENEDSIKDKSAEAENVPLGSENEKSDLENRIKGTGGDEKENETSHIQTEEDGQIESSDTENVAEFYEHISKEDLETEETGEESGSQVEESTEADKEQETGGTVNEQNGDATKASNKNDKNSSNGVTKDPKNANKNIESTQDEFDDQDNTNKDSESTQEESDNYDELIRHLESDQEESDAPGNVNRDSESTQNETDEHKNEDLESTQEGTEGHEEQIIDLESSSDVPQNQSNGENGEMETSLADTNKELENTKDQFDDIENVLASFESDSDEISGVVTLDSTADSNNSEIGSKRKRSDSNSDASDTSKKRRKLHTLDN